VPCATEAAPAQDTATSTIALAAVALRLRRSVSEEELLVGTRPASLSPAYGVS
jgi:hypothetical protein